MGVGPGRDEAFETAFDSLFPRARRLAFRILGDGAAAEDVAAEAMARTCLRWSKVRDLPWLDAWVLRVATNLALDSVKRRRPPAAPVESADGAEHAVLRMAMVEALHALPRRQREVLALRYLSDLSETDVAASLGISPGSVKTHTSRGLAALRARLGDDEPQEVPLATNGI
jgi:RNA polymerase sigma-70 factor (sigma-E family)